MIMLILITSNTIYIPLLQQIQSDFVIVIHPGSRTLRIGRATDTLPVTVPHVIARRHKQSGQPKYEDAWLLREGLNVRSDQIQCLSQNTSRYLLLYPHFFFLLSARNQKVLSRGRMVLRWLTRPFGPKRCPMECGGLPSLLNRCVRGDNHL